MLQVVRKSQLLMERIQRSQQLQGTKKCSLDAKTLDLLTFTGVEELLRGTHLATVLSGYGKIFQESKGSADTYNLSRPVHTIDTFISHNWCIGRWVKLLCLVMRFNFRMALRALALLFLILTVLGIAGWLPVVKTETMDYPRGFLCRLLGPTTFTVVLVFRWQFSGGVGGPIVFLDKACIHQTDMFTQKLGIKKLGAFLGRSTTMMVIFTEFYLERLWTVYELASFLALYPVTQIRMVPTKAASQFATTLGLLLIGNIVDVVGEQFFEEAWENFKFWIGIVGLAVFVSSLRSLMLDRLNTFRRLESFDIRTCLCAVESDRPLVYRNIGLLMREMGAVPKRTRDEEVLLAFNEMVSTTLPAAFRQVGAGFSYRNLCVLGILGIATRKFDNLAGIRHGMPLQHAACYAPWLVAESAFVVPLLVILLATCMEKFLDCRSDESWDIWSRLFVAGVGVASIYALFFIENFLTQLCLVSFPWLWASVAYTALMAAITFYIFRQPDDTELPRRPLSSKRDPNSLAIEMANTSSFPMSERGTGNSSMSSDNSWRSHDGVVV